MRRFAPALFVLAFGCDTNVRFDPEGLKCDPGNVCPSGYVCVDGVCRSQKSCPQGNCPSDKCRGVTCNAPPSAECLNATTLRVYLAGGTCDGQTGQCNYSSQDVSCPDGCENNVCKGDVCGNVRCDSPPAQSCDDGQTLRTYVSPGTCQNGVCSYQAQTRTCANGCENGACKNENLCQNVTCDSPPAEICANGKVRTYSAPGTCQPSTGQCTYPFSELSCNGSCVNNVCVPVGFTFAQTGPKVRHAVLAVDQAPGSGGDHVLAVGPRGQVSKWDGSSWRSIATNTTAQLNAVWLSGASSGWVVGQNRTVLRYDGQSLTPVTLPGLNASVNLIGVHGRVTATQTHVLVADDAGNWWRYDGTRWTNGNLPGSPTCVATRCFEMSSVWVNADDDERIAGRCLLNGNWRSCIGFAFSPTSTTWYVDSDSSTSDGFRSVGPSVDVGTTYAFAGRATLPQVRRHDGQTPNTFDNTGVPTSLSGGAVVGITGAVGTATPAVYVLTQSTQNDPGRLYRWTANGFDPAGPLLDLYLYAGGGGGQSMSRNESSGVIVADSGPESASIFRRGATSVASEVLDLGEHWRAAAYTPGGSLVLMNSDGDLAVRQAGQQRFSFRRSPTGNMNALVVGTGFALVAGDNGQAYRVTTTYAAVQTNTNARFLSACRVSDTEMYLVGEGGTIRRYDGTSLMAMNSGTTTALRAVACLGPGQALACGDSGTVLRLSGGSWSALPAAPGGPALSSCGVTPGGAIYVAADNAFARYANGQWTALPARPQLRALQVFGSGEIYAISNQDVVRFDGTSWTTKLTGQHPLFGGASMSGRAAFVGMHGTLVEGL